MAYGRNDNLSGGALAAIIIAVIVVVALALGLGLGLGLKDDSSTSQKGCFSSLQHVDKQNYDPAVPWDRVCPTPNKPTCPDGIEPVLFVVSMDGFRADYLTRGLTPTLQRLSECGASAHSMRPPVPTKTFPSHYTIVTGLYTESTGIVGNTMYDLNLDESFRLGGEHSYKLHWWGGEPIWRTVTKAGKTALTMYWPGSEVTDTGVDNCYFYDESIPFEDRINEVMGYFTGAPSTFPSLVMMYLHEPDNVGHQTGPYSSQLAGNLTYVDGIMEKLLSGIQQKGLANCANVLITSDHGMDSQDCERTILLEPYYGSMLDNLYVYEDEMIRMTSQYVERDGEIVETPGGASPEEILAPVQCTHYNSTLDWYADFMRKEDLPKRMHYANNARIEEVIGDVAAQYLVFTQEAHGCYGGAHGWDNIYETMQGIFIGYGPGFKSGVTTDTFDSIELYNLMTELLNLDNTAPNNGTKGTLHHILSTTSPIPEPSPPVGNYGTCPYPSDTQEVETRRNITTTCNWVDIGNFTETPISEVDAQLNLTTSEMEAARGDHLPLGVPGVDYSGDSPCQLTQRDFILGFSTLYHMPLWAAFKLGNNPSCSMLAPDCSLTRTPVPDLIRPDVRLATDQQVECSQYSDITSNIHGEFLYPPGFVDDTNPDQPFDAHIATNIVPMYEGFRTGVWQFTLDLLEEYAEKYGDLHVITGPIFDYNYDGRRDTIQQIEEFVSDGSVPVPTHYYVVATVCEEAGAEPLECVTVNTRRLALVLPHRQQLGNCWDRRYGEYVAKHEARLRDVELLTDLRLYPSVTTGTRLRLAVRPPAGLWDRISWMDLSASESDPCPPMARPAVCPHTGYDPAHPPLLLISLDGYRPDYTARGHSPTLARLQQCGTTAEYMRSQYPTYTFPNHYTITSGLYPETHGIVDNSMYDMEIGEAFWLGSPNAFNDAWWIGEPLWNAVEKQNKTSMTLMWPGSDVEIDGIRPTRYEMYDGLMPYSVRVDTVLDWLARGADGEYPDFMTLYFSKVDEAGHEGGPDGLEVNEALDAVEGALRRLMDGVYRLGLEQCINILVTSDHGMADMSCDWQVILNDYTDMNAIVNKSYTYQGAAARMSNKYFRVGNDYYHVDSKQQVPKQALVDEFTCQNPHLRVFDKVDLPKRHHYVNSPRIDDVVFVSSETWLVESFSPWCPILGYHGWDASAESMQAIFTGFGPGFIDNNTVEPFENIELYNLMTYLIGIDPSPNNGTEGSLYHLLDSPPSLPGPPPSDTYLDCPYAADDEEYNSRANLTMSGCSCVPPTGYTIEEADARLDKTPTDQDSLEDIHTPHGRPLLYGHDVCVLHQDNYVSGYSHELRMAAWTGFTLRAGQGTTTPIPACHRPDVRLDQSEQALCTDYLAAPALNMSASTLFPPAWANSDLEQMDSLILSNTVPMYNNFRTGIWQALLDRLSQWAAVYSQIHVVTGPIFDFDADGRRDLNITWTIEDEIPVPSHYFAIVMKCPGDCSNMNYDVISFVLPHKQNITNCMTADDFLMDNTARIRDVELLTDLELLTDARTTGGVRTRTYIPVQLWPTS